MPKILVIDDNEDICVRLKKLLEGEGYEAVFSTNGAEGVGIFGSQKPEIVLVDLNMPGMDGIEVLKKIKGQDPYAEVFIITGQPGVESVITALREGAFDYMTKPIDFKEASLNIKRALNNQFLRKELDRHIRDLEIAHKKLKVQQVQLVQSAKLTAVGELGAGVAHEMNQPLMAISAHLEALLMDQAVSSQQALKEKIIKIKDQFVRLGMIVKRMHDFAGSREEGFHQEDFNRPLSDVYYLMGQQLKDRNITVTLNLEEGLPLAYLDRYQIQDVLINFLVNARDAVEERFHQREGGKISIVSEKLKTGKGLLAGIIDNGIPVQSGTEANIFDPFFTTKPPGKGTGLGLSVCYTIIKNHNGIINFSTLKEGRKIFYFALPFDKDKGLLSEEDISENINYERVLP